MPRALKRSVGKDIALRHRKMLVGADITHSRNLVSVSDEAHGLAARKDALQRHSFG